MISPNRSWHIWVVAALTLGISLLAEIVLKFYFSGGKSNVEGVLGVLQSVSRHVTFSEGAGFLLNLLVTSFCLLAQLTIRHIEDAVRPMLTGAEQKLTKLSKELGSQAEKLDAVRQDLATKVDDVRVQNESFRRDIADGIVQVDRKLYRALIFDKDTGEMYYEERLPREATRNVLFNNNTLIHMLQTIATRKDGQSDRFSLLHNMGYSASSTFARHFQSHCEDKEVEPSLAAYLQEWAHYDENAGFGRLEVDTSTFAQRRVKVTLRHSFLTHDHDRRPAAESLSLCEFMVGYIEGLLKGFSAALYSEMRAERESITVTHDMDDCYRKHEDRMRGCVFWVGWQESTSSRGNAEDRRAVPVSRIPKETK